MSHSSDRMLAALRDAARQLHIQKTSSDEDPLVVARRRLLHWAQSRPDQLPPIPWQELDCSRQHPAGQPVLLAGEICYLRMKLHHSAGFSWVTPDRNPSNLTLNQPLDFFPLEEGAQELERACAAVAVIQGAAAGDPRALVAVLEAAGRQAAAALVEEHDDGYSLWDPTLVPYAFPSPRTLLQLAYQEERFSWERGVLQELCDGGGEHWEPGADAIPVPL